MSKAPKEARRKAGKEKRDALKGLPPLNLHAAGIDVGNAEHMVAVPPDRDVQPVQSFGSFTAAVHRLGKWLLIPAQVMSYPGSLQLGSPYGKESPNGTLLMQQSINAVVRRAAGGVRA